MNATAIRQYFTATKAPADDKISISVKTAPTPNTAIIQTSSNGSAAEKVLISADNTTLKNPTKLDNNNTTFTIHQQLF